MRRKMLLLTKSKKNHGYCIAGIDTLTGEWVRLSKEGESSFPKQDFKYSNGAEPEILDCIDFDAIRKGDNAYHPEDIIVDSSSLCRSSCDYRTIISNRLRFDYNNQKAVYYNRHPKLIDSMLPRDFKNNPYSLMIIEPENAELRMENGNCRANFSWKGIDYYDFRVTDIDIKSKMIESSRNNVMLDDVYFVISLGEAFEIEADSIKDYYKLVAAIIDKNNVSTGGDNKDSRTTAYIKSRDILCALADGIDPVTGEILPMESVVNRPEVIRSLFYAIDAIEKNMRSRSSDEPKNKKTGRKPKCTLSPDAMKQVKVMDVPQPITRIVSYINEVVDNTVMKKLNYKSALAWLLSNGYITEDIIEGIPVKKPTSKGENIGITIEQRISQTGKLYLVTLYSEEAQRMIVEHVNEF